ncbi:MAG: cobalamin biosynthesis protein [SAR324 cluster bacterium]|nr:cobalamin biosynthesis protein [SAR324 cluster bacterium]
MKVVLGLGCDRNTSLETLSNAVDLALAEVKIDKSQVVGLATIDKKADEVGLLELAKSFALDLAFYRADQLAKVEVPNPSPVVLKYMGTASVSEAAAILLGEGSQEDLILEKLKHKGADTKNATVSILKVRKT